MTWAFMSIYVMIAVFLSVGLAIGVFMFAFNNRLEADQCLFALAATAGVATFVFAQRDLSQVENVADFLGKFQNNDWFNRIGNFGSLGLCFAALIQLFYKGFPKAGAVIIAILVIQYYFVCFVMPMSFDKWFIFDHKLFYAAAALVIVIAPSDTSAEVLGTRFARIATIPAFASIAMLIFNYNSAVLAGYDSLLPFFHGRLFGATSHSNLLGAVCTFAILLIAAFPSTSRAERYILLGFNLTALLLSQSKTSWLTLIISISIVHAPKILKFRGRVPAILYVVGLLALAIVPAVLSITDQSIFSYFSGNRNVAAISTMTGRTDIWKATLYFISLHPITGPGYGSYLMGMQSLFPSLIPIPHNLFLSTLVQAGVIGIGSLVIMLMGLVVVATRLDGRNRRFALAFIVIFCLHGLSESTTFQDAFISSGFWSLLMYFRLLAVMSGEREVELRALAATPLLRPA